MTRPQTERHPDGERTLDNYLQLGKRTLSAESLRDAVVMHPLPRRDEIAQDLDADPRSIYFKQAARGVPIRMAILGWLTGALDLATTQRAPEYRAHPVTLGPNPCPNATCISRTEARHVAPMYRIASRLPLRAHCAYCSQELVFGVVGCSTTHVYHERDSVEVRKVRSDHFVFLRDASEGLRLGFTPSVRGAASAPGAALDR